MVRRFLRNESGATAVEYGLLAGLIGLVLIASLLAMGNNLGIVFNKASNTLASTR